MDRSVDFWLFRGVRVCGGDSWVLYVCGDGLAVLLGSVGPDHGWFLVLRQMLSPLLSLGMFWFNFVLAYLVHFAFIDHNF